MKIQVGDKNLHKMIQKALFDQIKKAHPIMIKTIKKEKKWKKKPKRIGQFGKRNMEHPNALETSLLRGYKLPKIK